MSLETQVVKLLQYAPSPPDIQVLVHLPAGDRPEEVGSPMKSTMSATSPCVGPNCPIEDRSKISKGPGYKEAFAVAARLAYARMIVATLNPDFAELSAADLTQVCLGILDSFVAELTVPADVPIEPGSAREGFGSSGPDAADLILVGQGLIDIADGLPSGSRFRSGIGEQGHRIVDLGAKRLGQ